MSKDWSLNSDSYRQQNSNQASLVKETSFNKYNEEKTTGSNHKNSSKSNSDMFKNSFAKQDITSLEQSFSISGSSKVKSTSFLETPIMAENPNPEVKLQDHNYTDWNDYIRDSVESIPKCIPPWAKTLRNKYGFAPSGTLEYKSNESKKNIREKIENLMKKHSEVMLVKRVESKKQLILEPSNRYDDIDMVRMKEKHTNYFMAPLKKNYKQTMNDFLTNYSKRTSDKLFLPKNNSSMSVTKETLKPQVKKEISSVLNSLSENTRSRLKDSEDKIKTKQSKCPKMTLSKIREYVKAQTMDPGERKLHEIIKVENIPITKTQDTRILDSKYIINLPHSHHTDTATINVIKIKEKHKLKSQNVENANEKVAEFHYIQKGKNQPKLDKDSAKECSEINEHLKKKTRSPTETTTIEVISRKTPLVSPLIDENKTDKHLLIQYENKTKLNDLKGTNDKFSAKTQLLGVKQNSEDTEEMYLFGTETVGTKTKEHMADANEIPLSLKDKVNNIFKELREMKFKPKPKTEGVEFAAQICPKVSSKLTQRFTQLETEVAMIQAVPEVKSAEVQVRQSLLMALDDPFMTGPHISYLNSELGDIAETDHSLLGNLQVLNGSEKEGDVMKPQETIIEDVEENEIIYEGKHEKVETKEENDIPSRILKFKPELKESGSMIRSLEPFEKFQESNIEFPQHEKKFKNLDKFLEFQKHDNEPGKEFREPEKEFHEPKKAFVEPEKVFQEPAKEFSKLDHFQEPDKEFLEPGKVIQEPKEEFLEPENVFQEPAKEFSKLDHFQEPDKEFLEPEKEFHEPKKEFFEPEKLFQEPAIEFSKLDHFQEPDKEFLEPEKVFQEQEDSNYIPQKVKKDKNKDETSDEMQPEDTKTSEPSINEVKSSTSTKTFKTSKSNLKAKKSKENTDGGIMYEEKETINEDEKEKHQSSIINIIRMLDKEDVRSYEFDKTQKSMMESKSSSKFHFDRDKIRKCMNWTSDTIYLEKRTCPHLVRGLAETALRQPADPISFLAHWIYKNCKNREQEERMEVFKEHLQLARTMLEVKRETKQSPKTFNTIHYPMKSHSSEHEQSTEDLKILIES